MRPIGYDMKRRVIAEDRVIYLKSGPLRSTLSHYTIHFSRLCFPGIKLNLSEIFGICLKRYDGLRFPTIVRIVSDGISEGLTLHVGFVGGGGAITGHRQLKIVLYDAGTKVGVVIAGES